MYSEHYQPQSEFELRQSVAYIYILDTYRRNVNRRKNKGRMKTSLEKYSPLTLLQGFERVVQGLHVRGCWRPNINFIFWPPLLMTVTLCLSCSLRCSTRGLGVHSIRAFPRALSVGCGLPYHISSLTLWKSASNCSGTQTQLN